MRKSRRAIFVFWGAGHAECGGPIYKFRLDYGREKGRAVDGLTLMLLSRICV
jgi:hypothetical protein